MPYRCLIFAAIVTASAAAVRAQAPHVDTRRGFEITLGPQWARADGGERIDPLASIVWQYAGGSTYLAIESRRLPGLALRLWASRWASTESERSRMGRLLARSRRVIAVTSEEIAGVSMLIASEFHRSGAWAYRVSTYRALRSPTELRRRLREAASTFRPRPVEIGADAPPPTTDRTWRRAGIAATLRTSGWRRLDPASRHSILPADLDVALRDDVHGYQGGLVALGEVASLKHLDVRVRSFTARLTDPENTRLLRRDEHLEGLCADRLGDGRRMAGLPVLWLIRAHVIAGQGVLLFAGLVGFELDEDRERLRAFFDRLGDRADWPSPRQVTMRRGRVIAPDARFQLALPDGWSVDRGDRAMSPLRVPGPPILVGVRDLEPGDPVRSATFFVVIRHRGRSPLFDGGVRDAQGSARIVTGEEVTFEGSFATARDYRMWVRDDAGIGWHVTARELITPDGGATLLIGHPDTATERLASEVARLKSAFRPYDSGSISGAAAIDFDGMRVEDGVWTDGLRGLTASVGEGWVWLDGDVATDIDDGATVAASREQSDVTLTLVSQYAPGVTAREWAVSQRIANVREGRSGQLYVDTRTRGAHFKSILTTRHGWCSRFTVSLPEVADSASRTAAFRALRSLEAIDDAVRHRTGANRAPTDASSPAARDASLGIALRAPGDWIPTDAPDWFPFRAIFAVRDPIRQRWLYAIESRPTDDDRAIGIATEALLRALPGGEVTKPARRVGDDIVVEGTARHGGLPSRWVVRVFRAPRGAVAVLAGQMGRTMPAEDRSTLFDATRAVAPSGPE